MNKKGTKLFMNYFALRENTHNFHANALCLSSVEIFISVAL